MLKAFQGFQPKQIFFVFLLVILFWLPAFIFPDIFSLAVTIYPSPVYPVLSWLTKVPAFYLVLLSFLFWLLLGYLLVLINIRHMFIGSRTILPLFFVVSASAPAVLVGFEINNLTLTFPFLLIAINRVFHTYRSNRIDFSFSRQVFGGG